MNPVDLAAMLADAQACGAYYIDADGRAAAVDAAERLEFALLPVDLRDCRDKDAALDRIAAALRFPHWFGGNWDALADCLNDLSWLPSTGYVIVLDHSQDWHAADTLGFEVLLEIANDAANGWADIAVPFWMLIPLPRARLEGLAGDATDDAERRRADASPDERSRDDAPHDGRTR